MKSKITKGKPQFSFGDLLVFEGDNFESRYVDVNGYTYVPFACFMKRSIQNNMFVIYQTMKDRKGNFFHRLYEYLESDNKFGYILYDWVSEELLKKVGEL